MSKVEELKLAAGVASANASNAWFELQEARIYNANHEILEMLEKRYDEKTVLRMNANKAWKDALKEEAEKAKTSDIESIRAKCEETRKLEVEACKACYLDPGNPMAWEAAINTIIDCRIAQVVLADAMGGFKPESQCTSENKVPWWSRENGRT